MDRRDFAKKTFAAGTGLFLLSSFQALQSKNLATDKKHSKALFQPNDAKKIFKEKGACSTTFCFLLNREFCNQNTNYELASTLLAGGLLQTGHQCGMLWGSSLALGYECNKKLPDKGEAKAAAIIGTQELMKSFSENAGTTQCRKITNTNFRNPFDMVGYMGKIAFQGLENSTCFVLAENWMPHAIKTAKTILASHRPGPCNFRNCASEVVKKMAGTEEEATLVAGFAGGMGLSGNACGALAAAIWMKILKWCRNNPGKNPPYFRNKEARKIMNAFNAQTNSEILCEKICKKKFHSIDDHSKYINENGCSKLIEALSKA